MNNLLSAKALNTLRRSLYGGSASLTFYKMTPADGEVEIHTTTSGWHIQRDNSDIDRTGLVNIWMSSESVPWKLDSKLHTGSKIKVTTNNRSQSYRISSIRPMQQLGSGWYLKCDPIENSTEPDNG